MQKKNKEKWSDCKATKQFFLSQQKENKMWFELISPDLLELHNLPIAGLLTMGSVSSDRTPMTACVLWLSSTEQPGSSLGK